MNVSCKRRVLGKMLTMFAVVMAVFVGASFTNNLQAQQEHATEYLQTVDFVDASVAVAIMDAYVSNLNMQMSVTDNTTVAYDDLQTKHNFATHVWEDVSQNISVRETLSLRYGLLARLETGTATVSEKLVPGTNPSNSSNPAFFEVVNLLKK